MMLVFNANDMTHQFFPFCDTVMKYIYKNISAPHLLKLYQTCKFFYAKLRLNIVEDFEISDDKDEERIVKNSMAIWQKNSSFSKLNNIWISNSFTYSPEEDFILNYKIFSRLTYKRLHMCGDSKVADYKFFVSCPTLRYLTIWGRVYCPESDQYLSIEECIEFAPHISTIDIHRDVEDFAESFPPINMTKLLSLERSTKLLSLHLYNVSKIPDPFLFLEFFKICAIPDVDYYFDFHKADDEYNVENVKTFYKTIDDGLRAWKNSLQLPSTILSSIINLSGKTAFITGASDGIGRATTILFRQLGASVIAVGKNFVKLKTLVDECQSIKNSGSLGTLWIPHINAEFVKKVFERIDYKFGTKFDIFVNIADTFGFGGIPDMKFEKELLDYYYIIESHYCVIQKSTPYLIEANGCVFNISPPPDSSADPDNAEYIAEFDQGIKDFETKLTSAGVRIISVNRELLRSSMPAGITDNSNKAISENLKKSHDEHIANTIAFHASMSRRMFAN